MGGRANSHLRWAGLSGTVSGVLLAGALLLHFLVLTPHVLTQNEGLGSTFAGVVGSSCIVGLGVSLIVAFVLGIFGWMRPSSARDPAIVYWSLALAIPLCTVLGAWSQFGWWEGRMRVASIATLAVAMIGGLVLACAAVVFGTRSRSAAAPPSWAWLTTLVLLSSLVLAPSPRIGWPPASGNPLRVVSLRREAVDADSGGPNAAARLSPPSVLLLTVDTLRADHMGSYGYGRDTTPFLDGLAKEGALVEHMVSAASCTVASTAAILTGLEPWCSGVLNQEGRIAPGASTLAERFQAGGFHTIAVVGNYLLTEGAGFSQGFDEFHNVFHEPYPRATEVTTRALELIDSLNSSGRPFFAWLHYMDPHDPYLPPEESYAAFLEDEFYSAKKIPVYDFGARGGVKVDRVLGGDRHKNLTEIEEGYVVARYDGELRQMDAGVGSLVRGLQERGLLGDLVIAFTADHGESMAEHQAYFAHCHETYDSTVRVPGFFWSPRETAPGQRIRVPATHVDIAPTLLRLAGLTGGADPTLHGIDLLGSQAASHKGRRVFTQSGWWDGVAVDLLSPGKLGYNRALVEDGWKYVLHSHQEVVSIRGPLDLVHAWRATLIRIWQPDGLYNLEADPAESWNRIHDEPERAQRMRRALAMYPAEEDWKRCPADVRDIAAGTAEEQEELQERLRTLGYIQ